MMNADKREWLITEFADKLDWDKGGGLLPVVVQDAASGAVLMLGYMNREALALTLRRGRVVFWSRSRERLWEKGETSGNTLALVDMAADCDWDTLLVHAEPQGPVCHTGARKCFEAADPRFAFLGKLEDIIADRQASAPGQSYTASLFAAGLKRMAQKVGEEGVETALAATGGDREELLNESADLLFHLGVLLRASDSSLQDVVARLEERHAG